MRPVITVEVTEDPQQVISYSPTNSFLNRIGTHDLIVASKCSDPLPLKLKHEQYSHRKLSNRVVKRICLRLLCQTFESGAG